MKVIYFHIDEFNRDAITASVLKDESKKRGWVLIYGNRVTSPLLKHFEWVFDVVILPKPTFIKSIFGYDKISSLKSKYVMLYTENIGIIANDVFPKMVLKGALDEEFMSGMTSCVDKVSAFCFWGEQVSETVKKTYRSLADRCYVVGHPRHDARALINENENFVKETVGIISRYCTLNDYYSRHPIDTIFDRYVKKDLFEFNNIETGDFLQWERRGACPDQDLYLEAIDVKNTVLIINRLNEAGYKVSFKIHPREKVSTWVNVFERHDMNVDVVNSDMPFTKWAKLQRYVIGAPSTSFYDCLMVGVTPINISGLDSQRHQFVSRMYEENNKLMPHINSPSSIDEILLLLESPRQLYDPSPDILNVLKAEANYPDCRKSGIMIGDVLEGVLQSVRKRNLAMILGRFTYQLISFTLNLILSITRKFGKLNSSHSANFLLTRSVKKAIDRLIYK